MSEKEIYELKKALLAERQNFASVYSQLATLQMQNLEAEEAARLSAEGKKPKGSKHGNA